METVRASIDRFEEGYAVVYADDGDKLDIPQELLPDVRAGTRLILYFEGKELAGVAVDEQATESARDRIKGKYERLKRGDHLSED
jgi:hypothetical protein